MVIKITGRLGLTKAEPERAVVRVGERVQWVVRVRGGLNRIPSVLWEVYFGEASPFREQTWKVASRFKQLRRRRWRDEPKALHVALIDAGLAREPGEYKYGIRAFETSSEELLGDDDPYIIVRPRLHF